MRLLRSAKQGPVPDHDQIGFWNGVSSATRWQNETTSLGRLGNDRPVEIAAGPSLPDVIQDYSLYRTKQNTFMFVSSKAVRSAAVTPNDTGYVTNASVGFSFAAWYRPFGGGNTQTFFERVVLPGGTGANGLLCSLTYLKAQNRFMFRAASGAAAWQDVLSPEVPTGAGWIAVELDSARMVRFYHSSVQGNQLGSAATLSVAISTAVATSASARWILGGSLYNVSGGSYNSPPTLLLDAAVTDISLWRRPLGEAKARSLYAMAVQPWDDDALLGSENYCVKTRVFIEDQSGVMQDLSDWDGQNWVESVTYEKDVDEATATATVRLRRRRGRLADLSPLNTTAGNDLSTFVDLRRRVTVERAFVPTDWNIEGWEWRPFFDGYIDDWAVEDDTLMVQCSDLSAVLNDTFVLDTRAYNYAAANKSAEEVQQQIITDFEPSLPRIGSGGGSNIRIGYKGFTKNPQVYTEAGTVTTPGFVGSNFMLRYNDVSSGPVMDALQAVSDQIGYATEFKYHEPWESLRLTTYSPRRTQVVPHERVERLSQTEALIEFREPHGLNANVPVTIDGSSFATSNSVATVMDFYRIITQVSAGSHLSTASLGSTGTVSFGYNYWLDDNSLVDLSPVRSSVNRIRNHAIVRFNRSASLATLSVSYIEVVGGIVTVVLGSQLGNLDPSSNGITFSLIGGTGGSAALNGTYSGRVEGSRQVVSDVPTGASDGVYNTNLPYFSSQYVSYREIVSTATNSLQAYGYLPVAVYEGSNLAISTEAEAQRLADNLISDLALPTVDYTLTTKVRPFEVHDLIQLPVGAGRGRWSTNQVVAVVGVTERYASGEAFAEYRVRANRPSRGIRWAERIVVTPGRPAPPNNNLSNIIDQAERWKLDQAAKLARRFQFIRQLPERREFGLRHDQTELWMSSSSAGFVPTESNRVGTFRGERFEVTSEADGSALTPGRTYYVRFGERDIFGNLSAISGVGAASTTTVPSFTARFLDETSSVLAANVSGATFALPVASGYTPMIGLTVDDGSDAAGLSHDNLSDFDSDGVLGVHAYTAPCDGTVLCSHRSTWVGDPTKVTNQTVQVLGGWIHARGATPATLSFYYGGFIATGAGPTVPFHLSGTAAVSCASGDKLYFVVRCSGNADLGVLFWAGSTATNTYGATSYSLVGQR